jgi:hypothetical protein
MFESFDPNLTPPALVRSDFDEEHELAELMRAIQQEDETHIAVGAQLLKIKNKVGVPGLAKMLKRVGKTPVWAEVRMTAALISQGATRTPRPKQDSPRVKVIKNILARIDEGATIEQLKTALLEEIT